MSAAPAPAPTTIASTVGPSAEDVIVRAHEVFRAGNTSDKPGTRVDGIAVRERREDSMSLDAPVDSFVKLALSSSECLD